MVKNKTFNGSPLISFLLEWDFNRDSKILLFDNNKDIPAFIGEVTTLPIIYHERKIMGDVKFLGDNNIAEIRLSEAKPDKLSLWKDWMNKEGK